MFSWLLDCLGQAARGESAAQRVERIDLPGFVRAECPACQRLLVLHEDRVGDILRCNEDTADGCPALLLVTCEAYNTVTPGGGPVRLKLEQLHRSAEWITAARRAPKTGARVLAWASCCGCVIARYHGRWLDDEHPDSELPITHWQPLPGDPAQEAHASTS